METTANYQLKKPSYTEGADIQALNDNADVVDAELAAQSEQLTALDAAKADKVAGAIAGHIATFDANGNLQDSGYPVENTIASKTIYVTKLGNDETGDGTVGNPYLTITKAAAEIKKIPPSSVTHFIRIGDGTYNEGSINFYHNAYNLIVVSISNDATKVIISSGIYCYSPVNISYITANFGNAITVYRGYVSIDHCIINSSGSSITLGIRSANGGEVVCSNTQFNNCTACMRTDVLSILVSATNSGSGNGTAFNASGGIIMRSGTTPTATTLESKSSGGQIFS